MTPVSRRRASRLPRLAVVLPLAWALLCGSIAAATEPPPADDPRARVVVLRDCVTEVGHAELTLFANGTLRLREGERRHERMLLAELSRVELASYLRRLEAIDLSETEEGRAEVEGALVESCRVELALPDRDARSFLFGRFDSLPLALSHLLAVLDELDAETRRRAPRGRLPRGYEPRPGDVLERIDGARYEVVGFTADLGGVELLGLDTPLTVYINREALAEEFVKLVQRRRKR